MVDRPVTSHTAHARIVFWHYKFQSFPNATSTRLQSSDQNVFAVERGLLEADIVSVDCQKSMRSASGTFEVVLLPSRNWRQVLAPGDWLVIHLYNAVDKFEFRNKNIVMLGNVDRVARVKEKDQETDKTLVRYRVSGRDFGKVFEDTDLFFSPYFAQFANPLQIGTFLQTRGLGMKGNPTTLVSNLVDVFLSGTGGKVDDPALGAAVTPALNQWKIPTEISQIFSGGGDHFHDILEKSFTKDLPGYKPRSQLTPGSNGALWGTLKRNANEIANHLYCDLAGRSTGGDTAVVRPTIYLRTIPCSPFFKDTPGQLGGTSKSLMDYADEDGVVEISTDDILFENVGRDGNYRFNMIWLEPKLTDKSAVANVFGNVANLGGIGLPMQNNESIQRYGLKKFQGTLDFTYQDSAKEVSLNVNMFKSFINLVYDIQAYHHCYETGTIECNGKIDAELGRVLRVTGVRGATTEPSGIAQVPGSQTTGSPAKLYYIEGWKHSWKFPGKWTTEFMVTMGQWESRTAPFIDLDAGDNGAFDRDFDNSSLVKTTVPRPGNAEPDGAPSLEEVDKFKTFLNGGTLA